MLNSPTIKILSDFGVIKARSSDKSWMISWCISGGLSTKIPSRCIFPLIRTPGDSNQEYLWKYLGKRLKLVSLMAATPLPWSCKMWLVQMIFKCLKSRVWSVSFTEREKIYTVTKKKCRNYVIVCSNPALFGPPWSTQSTEYTLEMSCRNFMSPSVVFVVFLGYMFQFCS